MFVKAFVRTNDPWEIAQAVKSAIFVLHEPRCELLNVGVST